MSKLRIAVGISGGVDSSVAALLLVEQGYEVHGVFMKNWEETFEVGYCAAAEDLEDARAVCATLNIPLHQVNFSAAYQERVFRHFLAEYAQGRTPNPDVLCNSEIKFRAFLDYAQRFGASTIATGHYAQCRMLDGRQHLFKGHDADKDQSYFLHRLNQQQLANARFPLAALCKNEVRQRAATAGLLTHAKKDSTGICFIGERRFREFLQNYLPAQPGEIYSLEGEYLGTHAGLMFHTIGQRQGLQIGGKRNGNGAAWYVVAKDLAQRRLLVVQGAQHPALFQQQLLATQLHWIAGEPPPLPWRGAAKIRYRQPDQECVVEMLDSVSAEVRFAQPQRAVTPGQSVVFYQGTECLGGGIIA